MLAMMALAYPNMKITEPMIDLWQRHLNDYDYRTAMLAIDRLIKEKTFPPSIAGVREACEGQKWYDWIDPILAWQERVNLGLEGEEEIKEIEGGKKDE